MASAPYTGVFLASGYNTYDFVNLCHVPFLCREYFQHVKSLRPVLSLQADRILSRYYAKQRSSDGVDQARTTVRLLQSCVRLAQGHARLLNRTEVTTQDAVRFDRFK